MTWHGGITIVGNVDEISKIERLLSLTGKRNQTRKGETVWQWQTGDDELDINELLEVILATVAPVASVLAKELSEGKLRGWVSVGWDQETAPEVVIRPDLLEICGSAMLELSIDFPFWR